VIGFSKHNERLAVGTDDGVLSLLDPAENYDAAGEIDVSDSPVMAIDWSSRHFALSRKDGSVTLYDKNQVCSNFCVPLADLVHKGPISGLAFGPSSRFLAVAGSKGLVSVYSAKGGWVLCHQLRATSDVSSLVWNASGRFLALGLRGGGLQVVDTVFWADVDELSQIETASDQNDDRPRRPTNLAFSQNGNALALTGEPGGMRVIDTTEWKVSFQLGLNRSEDLDASTMSM